ncbi:flagellar export protein FliJ [Mangrovibacter phragmitis]|uniref:Flagellar FliJ protein n=1 Tax=Mangrovibacter phragmitis TaxID=1691903 RepID=A0A1B7L3S8_9ENTR|nr:flagellar export protein FliJ [Mangrovibacter phragmitis]OAT76915.1 flagellar export protein FliJ [Mangrovibacter phragmitis]
MTNTLHTLEQLHQLRRRQLDEMSRDFSHHQQQQQRLKTTLDTLTRLATELPVTTSPSPGQLCNQVNYQRTLQRVIDGQTQAHALAQSETRRLQGKLLLARKKLQGLESLLGQHREQQQETLRRKEQQVTDALAAQHVRHPMMGG